MSVEFVDPPAPSSDEEEFGNGAPRLPRWVVLTLALVVAATATGITVKLVHGHQHPAATATKTGSQIGSTPGPSATNKALPGAPLVCSATLPTAWQAALASTASAEGAQSATPMQELPNGDVLVARDFGQGRPRDLAIVSPGKAPRSIFSVPDPQELNVQNAQITGHWLVVGVGAHPRPQKHTIPGDSPMPNVVHLYVVDLRDGSRTEIAASPVVNGVHGGRTINLAAVLNGKVYWDVRRTYASPTGVIKSYDPATRRTATTYSGTMGYLVSSAAGIGTGSAGQVYVRAPLPPVVRANLSARYPLTVATDGRAYVWEVAPRVLAWWQPGLAKPRYLRLREPAGFGSIVLSGQYVMTVQGGEIIDVATGAAAHYPNSTRKAPSGQLMQIGTLAHGRWVAELDLAGKAHWQNGYWVDRPAQLAEFDTSTLPDLHC